MRSPITTTPSLQRHSPLEAGPSRRPASQPLHDPPVHAERKFARTLHEHSSRCQVPEHYPIAGLEISRSAPFLVATPQRDKRERPLERRGSEGVRRPPGARAWERRRPSSHRGRALRAATRGSRQDAAPTRFPFMRGGGERVAAGCRSYKVSVHARWRREGRGRTPLLRGFRSCAVATTGSRQDAAPTRLLVVPVAPRPP
jgi:hypothetical protein